MPFSLSPRILVAAWASSAILLAAALLWGYWPSLRSLEKSWSTDPRYSHGFLIPLFSAYLIWLRWDQLKALTSKPSANGLLLIAAGAVLFIGGAVTNHEWIEAVSLLPSLAGLCVLVWGWDTLRVAFAPIAFLVFMIPLPYLVEVKVGGRLQTLATHASAIVLQIVGLPALEEGNTITLGHAKLGVVEACNGLSMLTFFFAISVGLLLVTRRPWIERFLIIGCAIPIALIANVGRITATGVLTETVGHEIAGINVHDLAGYLMMPFALALLSLENKMISTLFRDEAAHASERSTPLTNGRDADFLAGMTGHPTLQDEFPSSHRSAEITAAI